MKQTLRELAVKLDCDFLAVGDAKERPIAIVFRPGAAGFPLEALPSLVTGTRLLEAAGKLWETTSARLVTDQGRLGVLAVGRRFDLAGAALGDLALLRNGHPVATAFPSRMAASVERALGDARAGTRTEALEARIDGGLELIDRAMREYMSGVRNILLAVGIGGMLLALFVATAGSASMVRPLDRLLESLRKSESTGRLQPEFYSRSALREANLLADALNRAALAINDSRLRLDHAYLEFTETIAQALDTRDPYSAGHSNRVSACSVAVAQEMNLDPSEIETIRIGAQLHDIGKIGIPDAILQKPGRLTVAEFGLIKMHPQTGKRILETVERFREILPMVELHHEDYDGGGYPYGLVGDQTPLCARIVRVADAFDAMSSTRSYRRAMDLAVVLAELSAMRNRHFDPAVVDAFLAVLKKGKYALLDGGPFAAGNVEPSVSSPPVLTTLKM